MYPHQRERLTAALAAHRAAVLIGSTAANVTYLTGFRNAARLGGPDTCTLAVMAPAGTALVIPTIEAPAVADADAAVDHVVPYGRFVFDYAAQPGEIGTRVREWTAPTADGPADAVAAALDALGVTDGPIALDEGGLSPAAARAIAAALPGRAVVDGARVLLDARQVKGPWEIEALERALGVAEEALNAVVQALAPGTTEREATALFEAEVRRRDGTPSRPLITFGARTALPVVPPSDRALRSGDLARLDVGCTWQGYQARVTRAAVMGSVAPRQETVFEAIAAGLDAGIAAIRPGASAGDVFAATVDAVRTAGLPQHDREHVGHGIGLDRRETPVLHARGDATLEGGMVLLVETAHYEHGWGGVQLAETVLVTRAGPRVMNRSHRGLLVLD